MKNKLLVVMTVWKNTENEEDDEILNQRVYNFLDPQQRQKIAKTAWWAMHNGYEMITRPLKKDENVDIVGHKNKNFKLDWL